MNRNIIVKELNKYLLLYHLSEEDNPLLKRLKNTNNQEEIDLSLCSEDFFNFMLYESDLDIETKTQLAIEHKNLILNPPVKKEITEESSINSIDKVMEYYNQQLKNRDYNFQINFFGKTLPVSVRMEIVNASRHRPRHIEITYIITICRIYQETRTLLLFHKQIKETRALYKKMGFYDLFNVYGLHKLETDLIDYEQLLRNAGKLEQNNGMQFLTSQKVLDYDDHRNQFVWYLLSNSNSTSKVIIESDLERKQSRNFAYDTPINDSNKNYTTPYVRIFSLSQKRYYFIHIEDLLTYQYDKDAFSKLVIPESTRRLLTSIFQSNINDYYGDFIKSKHGGMVILAEGPTGVGKTSTAEVYAELLEKPLYMVQLDELGTNTADIEKNLSIIFKRVQKWQAVMLFDEIDVYLFCRENDLMQSAIVGVFLRLLDYFTGLIFFTTNRSSVLDPAILSRISLKIKYEKLNEQTQLEIWKSKLDDAGLTIDSLEMLPGLNLNGRQIKNTIRVAKVVFGNLLNEKELVDLIEAYVV